MGYAPPPPPPRAGQPAIIRGRRSFLREVPGPDSGLWMLGGRGRRAELGCEIEVLPYKHKWEWRVRMTMNGLPNPGRFENQTWRRRPMELRGRCRNQGDAWARARSIVNDVRARHAEVQVVEMRRHTERVPL